MIKPSPKPNLNLINNPVNYYKEPDNIIIEKPLEIKEEQIKTPTIHTTTTTTNNNNEDVSYTDLKDIEWLYPLPSGIPKDQEWRYKSTNLYWSKNDTLYRKFERYKTSLELPPLSVQNEIKRVCDVLHNKNRDYLCTMFTKCYPNTLETTTSILEDNTAFIITGDIPLMWMRDSSAQVHQYFPLLKNDPYIQILIEGTIRRQIQWIKLDPYGSSFRLKLDFDNKGKDRLTEWDIKSGRTIHVSMHDYEIDSLCYFLRLSYNYMKIMNECYIFDNEWLNTAKTIVDLWILEQNHNELSNYTYPILANNGQGSTTCYTGMTWGGSRPSDDPCKYHFSIPSNMFAVVTLRYIKEILNTCYINEDEFYNLVDTLEKDIDKAIATHGVLEFHNKKIYAYEVSGCGDYIVMDDANVPSLLSMDYLGYSTPHDPSGIIKQNTYDTILSDLNPYFFSGSHLEGIGSPHTNSRTVWPMSLIIKALSFNNKTVVNDVINMLESTDAGTGFMHESISVNNPNQYTRKWFAWANSLFSELIITHLDNIESKD